MGDERMIQPQTVAALTSKRMTWPNGWCSRPLRKHSMPTTDRKKDIATLLAGLTSKMSMQPADESRRINADLVSVDTLYSKVLTDSQLDAIAQIQEGMQLIAQVEARINAVAIGVGLHDIRLFCAEVGLLNGRIEDMLFDSSVAAARLRNGGLQPKVASKGRAAA